ncbi:RNA binding protein, heterogenous nuclear RNP-K like protein [Coemansia sp. RSA 552]|nr:RNA binding protein, heterogenous nuclear RNP-K like protein [Coemansia sp. RSA 552]
MPLPRPLSPHPHPLPPMDAVLEPLAGRRIRAAVSSESDGDSSIGLYDDTPIVASPEPRPSSRDEDRPAGAVLRLVFSPEDGGMLIGKGGRHITRLKEATSASWFISGNSPDGVDRMVVLRGSAETIAQAARALATHIGEQSCLQLPTLRILFPSRSIGSILGPGGTRAEKMRADLGVSQLHIYRDPIPFTHERIVEVSGSPAALEAATEWLLRLPDLAQHQQATTQYMPVQNGLRQMILRDRQGTAASQSSPASSEAHSMYGLFPAASSGHGRKRSRSALSHDLYRPPVPSTSTDHKRPRRASDHGTKTRTRTSRRHSPSPPHSSSRRPPHTDHEEKLVVPDSVAGRLIGRNGSHLAGLKASSGARIELSPRTKTTADRIVTVAGSASRVSHACRLIRDSVQSFQDQDS